jgi:predicted TIM-barrel enzyme
MAKRYPRDRFLARLRKQIELGRPLLMAGAGSGVCAKFIEQGGVDILGVYNTGYFRMQGYGSLMGMLPVADANGLVFKSARREILPQVKETPVIAGLNGVDPFRNMPVFLDRCRRIGISGVHNFPTVAWFDGVFRETLEGTGLGYEHEINMLNQARELDMLTIGYAFNQEDTRRLMEEARPDVYIFHAGITAGGSTGFVHGRSLEETAEASERHFELAKRIKPDVILLAHGAAIADPGDAQFMLDHTCCHGVQLGSGIERLAIEKPLVDRTKAFKTMKFGARVQQNGRG